MMILINFETNRKMYIEATIYLMRVDISRRLWEYLNSQLYIACVNMLQYSVELSGNAYHMFKMAIHYSNYT